jgi:hypothetical protein
VSTLNRALTHDRASLKRQQASAKAAQRALDRARDAAAAIHGKGTADEKHAATMRVRRLTKTAKTRADRVKATEKFIDNEVKTRDAAKDRQEAALAAAAQIRLGREDFISAEIRNPNRRTEDPLAYVDQLRQMSRDTDFSPTRRKAMDDAANRYEAQLVRLTKSSEEAAKKLDDLKQSSAQLHDQTAQAIRGGFSLGGATQAQRTGSWVTRNGMRFQTTTTGASGSGIADYYMRGAQDAKTFASALQAVGRPRPERCAPRGARRDGDGSGSPDRAGAPLREGGRDLLDQLVVHRDRVRREPRRDDRRGRELLEADRGRGREREQDHGADQDGRGGAPEAHRAGVRPQGVRVRDGLRDARVSTSSGRRARSSSGSAAGRRSSARRTRHDGSAARRPPAGAGPGSPSRSRCRSPSTSSTRAAA